MRDESVHAVPGDETKKQTMEQPFSTSAYSTFQDGSVVDAAIRVGGELQSHNQKKETLIDIAAHELGGPLFVIRSCAELLREGASWKLNDRERQLLLVIRGLSLVMTRVVGDLRDVSSIESGVISINIRDEEFLSLVNSCIAFNSPLAQQRNIVLSLDSDIREHRVRVDPIRVEQVFSNLIHNAIKYSSQGSRVKISVTLERNSIVTAVEDQGVGMSEQEVGNLFKSLDQYAGDISLEGHGAGLGLIIAGMIVRAHGGTIWARSEVGSGSTFYVSLPIFQSS